MQLFNRDSGRIKLFADCTAVVLAALFFFATGGNARAQMKAPPPEKIKVIFIGDRVVDVAFNLGVVGEAMSVRGAMWQMAKSIQTTTRILGCPRCIVNDKSIVPDAIRKFGVKRIIVEKSEPYCLYMPTVKPENIVPILAGLDVNIEYVDFTLGLEAAIRQTARLVNRESHAEDLIQEYTNAMVAVQKLLPTGKSQKTVVILNGTYLAGTGKTILRVEAPGGYADRFLLQPLGYINAGASFKEGDAEPTKGHYTVRKRKQGMVLEPLIRANPDVIVMTGDAYAVQKALAEYGKSHLQLAGVSAVKNLAMYALPCYVDSSVIEYPKVLEKWAVALSR